MAKEEKLCRPQKMTLRRGAAAIAKEKRENRKFTESQKRKFNECLEKFSFETPRQYVFRRDKMIRDQVIIDKKEALKRKRERINKKVRYSKVKEREFYELKFYGVALFNTAVKFGMHTEVLRLLTFFYDNREFTQEEFIRVYKITELNPKFSFKYFVDKGFIRRVTYKQHFLSGKVKDIKTNKYKLTFQTILRVTGFYEVYMNLLDLDEGNLTEDLVSRRMVKIVNDIERECNQIIAGKLSPETVEDFKNMLDE